MIKKRLDELLLHDYRLLARLTVEAIYFDDCLYPASQLLSAMSKGHAHGLCQALCFRRLHIDLSCMRIYDTVSPRSALRFATSQLQSPAVDPQAKVPQSITLQDSPIPT